MQCMTQGPSVPVVLALRIRPPQEIRPFQLWQRCMTIEDWPTFRYSNILFEQPAFSKRTDVVRQSQDKTAAKSSCDIHSTNISDLT